MFGEDDTIEQFIKRFLADHSIEDMLASLDIDDAELLRILFKDCYYSVPEEYKAFYGDYDA